MTAPPISPALGAYLIIAIGVVWALFALVDRAHREGQ